MARRRDERNFAPPPPSPSLLSWCALFKNITFPHLQKWFATALMLRLVIRTVLPAYLWRNSQMCRTSEEGKNKRKRGSFSYDDAEWKFGLEFIRKNIFLVGFYTSHCMYIYTSPCVCICNATLTYEIASFRDSLAVTRQRRRQLLGELLPSPILMGNDWVVLYIVCHQCWEIMKKNASNLKREVKENWLRCWEWRKWHFLYFFLFYFIWFEMNDRTTIVRLLVSKV